MRIAFEVNGVLRDTIKKLESTYEKYLIDELEVGEEGDQFQYEIVRPINTEVIKDHFKFQSEDELYEFIYIENPMTIFGHAPSTEMNTFQVLNQIYKELRNEDQIIIVSDEIGRSKPSTLFFLSKFGCEI
jgi:Cdc6-like AAA superfamily ATPase